MTLRRLLVRPAGRCLTASFSRQVCGRSCVRGQVQGLAAARAGSGAGEGGGRPAPCLRAGVRSGLPATLQLFSAAASQRCVYCTTSSCWRESGLLCCAHQNHDQMILMILRMAAVGGATW